MFKYFFQLVALSLTAVTAIKLTRLSMGGLSNALTDVQTATDQAMNTVSTTTQNTINGVQTTAATAADQASTVADSVEDRVVEVYSAAMVLADGPIGGAVQAQLNAKGVNITDTLIKADQAIEN